MATKAFISAVTRAEYAGDPVRGFQLTMPYIMTRDDFPEGGDRYSAGAFGFEFPVEESPSVVYALAYDAVLELSASLGWNPPAKSEIYVWLPTDFTVILPDPPPAAPAALTTTTATLDAASAGSFVQALEAALRAEHDAYVAKMAQPAANVIFPPTKPLLFDYFEAQA